MSDRGPSGAVTGGMFVSSGKIGEWSFPGEVWQHILERGATTASDKLWRIKNPWFYVYWRRQFEEWGHEVKPLAEYACDHDEYAFAASSPTSADGKILVGGNTNGYIDPETERKIPDLGELPPGTVRDCYGTRRAAEMGVDFVLRTHAVHSLPAADAIRRQLQSEGYHAHDLLELHRMGRELLDLFDARNEHIEASADCFIQERLAHCTSEKLARADEAHALDAKIQIELDKALDPAMGCIPSDPNQVTPCDDYMNDVRVAVGLEYDDLYRDYLRMCDSWTNGSSQTVLAKQSAAAPLNNEMLWLPFDKGYKFVEGVYPAQSQLATPPNTSALGSTTSLTLPDVSGGPACTVSYTRRDYESDPEEFEKYRGDHQRYFDRLYECYFGSLPEGSTLFTRSWDRGEGRQEDMFSTHVANDGQRGVGCVRLCASWQHDSDGDGFCSIPCDDYDIVDHNKDVRDENDRRLSSHSQSLGEAGNRVACESEQVAEDHEGWSIGLPTLNSDLSTLAGQNPLSYQAEFWNPPQSADSKYGRRGGEGSFNMGVEPAAVTFGNDIVWDSDNVRHSVHTVSVTASANFAVGYRYAYQYLAWYFFFEIGVAGSAGATATVEYDFAGGTESCPKTTTRRTHTAPFASLDAFTASGGGTGFGSSGQTSDSLGAPDAPNFGIEHRIQGRVNLISWTKDFYDELVVDNETGASRKGRGEREVLGYLSGAFSTSIVLRLVYASITLISFDLFRWAGKQKEKHLFFPERGFDDLSVQDRTPTRCEGWSFLALGGKIRKEPDCKELEPARNCGGDTGTPCPPEGK